MPIIQVQIIEGRSDEQIKDLISDLTVTAMKSLDVKADQVRVIVQTVPKQYWGVGGVTKQELDGIWE